MRVVTMRTSRRATAWSIPPLLLPPLLGFFTTVAGAGFAAAPPSIIRALARNTAALALPGSSSSSSSTIKRGGNVAFVVPPTPTPSTSRRSWAGGGGDGIITTGRWRWSSSSSSLLASSKVPEAADETTEEEGEEEEAGGGDGDGGGGKNEEASSAPAPAKSPVRSSEYTMAKAKYHVVDKMYNPITTSNLDDYKAEHAYSIQYPDAYWGAKAKELLHWFAPFDDDNVQRGGFEHGDVTYFAGGKLNPCHNAIDRHVRSSDDGDDGASSSPARSHVRTSSDVAMYWEGDEPTDTKTYTYSDLLRRVSMIANALKSSGVRKGDVVTIYMPMIPELPMTMLACSRIGAVHSVVFAGFSSDALAQRLDAAGSRYLVTADVGIRGGRTIPLKKTCDEALTKLSDNPNLVKKVFVYERYHDPQSEGPTYDPKPVDVRMDPLVASQRPYCPCEWMDAEDPLFILYTSGSTGKPKGLLHTVGGYCLYAMHTTKRVFDVKPNDVYACVADCGWITGHTYIVYGPLLNGCSTFVFESTPMYPDPGRYWDMIQRHRINVLYTAPTAIRSLMRYGDDIPQKYDLSSLRILGTVGEPINPEAWRWYYEVIGKSKCTVVDTYWQTETGGHIITNLPGSVPMKPGSCTLPFYGVNAVVLDPRTGEELGRGPNLEGVLAIKQPWPGMARTCVGDHSRYLSTYMTQYPGYYFAGDSVRTDEDGYFFITGRVDDVINVSGHRIGTAEVESALVSHPAVSQAAVVGIPHDIKGQGICCYTTLTVGYEESDDLIKELRTLVRGSIGPFATPDVICPSPSLPMTRSGKIMRRILRKIASGETDTLGDTSTLADPSVVDTLIEKMEVHTTTTSGG